MGKYAAPWASALSDRQRDLAGEAMEKVFEIYIKAGGWPMILSGLKTLLETGETLTTPGSLMYLPEPPAGGAVGPATSRLMAEMPEGQRR